MFSFLNNRTDSIILFYNHTQGAPTELLKNNLSKKNPACVRWALIMLVFFPHDAILLSCFASGQIKTMIFLPAEIRNRIWLYQCFFLPSSFQQVRTRKLLKFRISSQKVFVTSLTGAARTCRVSRTCRECFDNIDVTSPMQNTRIGKASTS